MENLLKHVVGKDFTKLKREITCKSNENFVIYGCGGNGEVFLGYLSIWGIEIEYFVDKQAEIREFEVLNKKVVSPTKFIKDYKDEIVIISPDDHFQILSWLLDNGIKRNKILLPFSSKDWNVSFADNICSNDIDYVTAISTKEVEVTVFSIVYDTPEILLRRSIESVLRQTEQNFKYVIVDNGSTDGSNEIIQQYCKLDSRIALITLEKNLLWTDSELLEILRANIYGKYVCELDSDDYYEPSFLDKTKSLARKNEVDMVQVNTLTYSEDYFKYHYFTQNFDEDIFLTGNKLLQFFSLRILTTTFWGKLYAADIFKKLIDRLLFFNCEERKKKFILDISWVSILVDLSSKICICSDTLHVRTWRAGSEESASANVKYWLGSIVYSMGFLEKKLGASIFLNIFADVALIWLFGLNRERLSLLDFDETFLHNKYVLKVLKRPPYDNLILS